MNNIKKQQKVPDILQHANITSLYKGKGEKSDMENQRDIFRVSVFRFILDRLIYNDEYQNIDHHMSDSNGGARKERNIRDNLFVLNGV